MKGKSVDHKEAAYGPVKKKTPKAIFMQFFEKEFPQMGELSRGVVVDKLFELIQQCFPSNKHMKMGQMMWFAVDTNETSGYGKPIEKNKLKPVFLDVVTEGDIISTIQGTKKKDIRKDIEVRLFEQSHEQKAELSYTDVATIMNLSPGTIARHIREYEKESGKLVPRRGTIHDIGPSLTHKKTICYKFIVEGKSVEQVAKETNHSPEAITRYVKDYKRISACLAQNLSDEMTSYVTKTSKKLIAEYKALIEENNIDIINDLGDNDIVRYS